MFAGTVPQLLAKLKKTASMSEGRRLVFCGAVKLNDNIVEDITQVITFKPTDLIQLGRQEPFVLTEKDLA